MPLTNLQTVPLDGNAPILEPDSAIMPSDTTLEPSNPRGRPTWREYSFAVFVLAVGALLRLSWGQDIEFKHDESFMFERAMHAGISEPFPWIGMPSGVGTPNPGLSIWLFVGLARLFGIGTPPGLARAVQITNVAALTLAMVLALRYLGDGERRWWLWAIALACVNPFAVLLQRKLWAQSLLPLFCVLLIAGWWRRHTRWGAFLWGLLGALLGQVHMSGFFFAGALWLWTVLGARAAPLEADEYGVRWRAWLAGSALGALTLLPWVWYLTTHGSGARPVVFMDSLIDANLYGTWYWVLWVTGALGLGISYSLGSTSFGDFLRYPLLGASPTYAIACAHVVLLMLGLWVVVHRGWQIIESRRVEARALLGQGDSTSRIVSAGVYGLGLLLTLSSRPIVRHYLIVTFPLEWLWLSRQVRLATRRADVLLGAVWLCELTIAAGFLYYIHVNHGAPAGDYGVTYGYTH